MVLERELPAGRRASEVQVRLAVGSPFGDVA